MEVETLLKLRFAAGCLVTVLVCAGTPALADEHDGFFGFAQANSTKPMNLDHRYGAIEDNNNVGEILVLEPDSEVDFRIGVGWSRGEKGRFSISVWDFSLSEGASDSLSANETFDDDMVGNFVGGPIDFETASEVDASSIDFEYARDHEISDGFDLTLILGLRSVEYEETYGLEYPAASGQSNGTASMDVDGMGAKVGLGTRFHMGGRFSVGGGVAVSYMSGESEEMVVETGEETRSIDTDASGMLVDVNVGVTLDLGKWVDVSLLLSQSSWSDLVTSRVRMGDDPDDNALLTGRDNVSFDSIGIMVKVGG